MTCAMTCKTIVIAALAAISAAGASCTRTAAAPARESDASSPAALAARLDSLARARKFAVGHHDDTAYGHSWKYEAGRSDVLETAGDYPAIMSWDLGMLEMGDSLNLDSVPFALIKAEVAAQAARGGASTFSWHPRNPVTGGDSWDCSDSTVVARILGDSAVMARYDGWCAALADFFNELTDSTGARIPVIFRPLHEHTGSWFWWGARYCTPDQYRGLWKRMRDVFDARGTDNVLWAYSPDRVAGVADYMERYPGDDMVDIMGVDVYHFNGEEGLDEYRRALESSLGAAMTAAADRGKLLALTETGSEGLPMERWFTEVLLPIVRTFPVSYVTFWRNAHDKPQHFYVPYPGCAAEADFKAFRTDSATVFCRTFKNF